MRDRLKDTRAITLRMPWPHLVAWGFVQDLAVVTFDPGYRGNVILHAGREWDEWRFNRMTALMLDKFDLVMHRDDENVYLSQLDGIVTHTGTMSQMPCIVNLDHVSKYDGKVTWHINNIEPLPLNVTAHGWPGLWTPWENTKERMLHAIFGSLEPSVEASQEAQEDDHLPANDGDLR